MNTRVNSQPGIQAPGLDPDELHARLFDAIDQVKVHKDCTIRFEGRTYSVPYRYADNTVEVRGCSGFVQIVDAVSGAIPQQYPRKTQELLLIDPACCEPIQADDSQSLDVPRPLPLGHMGHLYGVWPFRRPVRNSRQFQ